MASKVNKVVPAFVISLIALFVGALVLPVSVEIRSLVYRLGIVALVECVIFVGARYLWKRVSKVANPNKLEVEDPGPGQGPVIMDKGKRPVSTQALQALLLAVLGMAQFSFLSNFLIGTQPHWFSHLSYICLGFLLHCGLCLLVFDVGKWLMVMCRGRHQNGSRTKHSARGVMKFSNVKVFIAMFYGLSVGLYGLYCASGSPAVKRIQIPLKGLPQSLDGLKVVQISDIHLGPTVNREKLTGVVHVVNSLNADVVVVVGDLVDGKVEKLRDDIQPMQDIQSKYGKYYVTGNHEYYTGDVDNWFEHLATLGVHALHNDHIHVPQQSSNFFCLAGVDDVMASRMRYDGHGMDIEKAVESCDPQHPIILLAHQPVAAKAALDSKYGQQIGLVLSGHTHGGQMFPVMIVAYLFNPFFRGLYQYKGSYVYVSEGSVYWGIPMRIGSSMEVTEITLRAANLGHSHKL